MSNIWGIRAYKKISQDRMKEARRAVRSYPYRLGYDNLNIPFVSYSQRMDNKSHFDSGTTGSVFYKPYAPPEPPLVLMGLQEARIAGRKNPISLDDIITLDLEAAPILHEHKVYLALKYLLDSPDFSLSTYEHQGDALLAPPLPIHQLPHGREHITKQSVLGTVHIDESTYEGTDKLVTEWFRQLGLYSEGERKHTGMNKVLPWIGDQLTVERLRGLANYRGEDRNGYDRMDYMLVNFGWFHFEMLVGHSLHKQYFGTTAGRGLRYAFGVLGRTGLQTTQVKGSFYHHLREGLAHVAEAHFRACWKKHTGVTNLADLRTKSPQELRTLAEDLICKFASTDALEDHDDLLETDQDDYFRNATMFQRDVLPYFALQNAIRSGDVGLLEKLLPHFFFRFCGTSNNKYAIEILELLQGLHREWPENVRYVIIQCSMLSELN
ncbi:hypothetical protein PsYK624_091880 [Phanerochaete sordida]|uniref:DUF6589 domain-containing protein n=1 Tax=Phanerochaete sordida TaxID=48140 RepID=A0A9P3GET4_9APHY|nr:hypothetical protein PsYK624_091880 [Phanerochaete sordida]